MKNFVLAILAFCVSLLSSCELVGGIFKAGYYVGIFVVVLVLAVVFFIISKIRG